MLMLALLLVLATGAFTAVAVVENFSGGPDYAVEVFGNQIATLSPPGVFLSGVGLALIFCLGLAVLAAGLKRGRRVRGSRVSEPVASTSEEQKAQQQRQSAHRRRGRHIFGH
ncbi:hypothetical protein [Streptomyces coeruleorubidus]|uniref:hypothetical protein n=1 Tax=Streptomyces coeruleorubidus TaxID=116188 RepID=UPI0034051AFD